MSEPTTDTHRPVRLASRDQASPTVRAGTVGIVCLTVLGLAIVIVWPKSETAIMGIVGTIGTCVGYIAGRNSVKTSATNSST